MQGSPQDINPGSLAGNLLTSEWAIQARGNVHHTKVKADTGLAMVIADLAEKGYVPCVPLSEHQPYDLLVVLDNGNVVKLQVKYACLRSDGTVNVKFRSSWADKNGTHTKKYKENDFDFYAVYCPEKKVVLYIPNTLNCPKRVRFEPSLNNQRKSVNWAHNYLDIKRESSETIRRTPETVKT